MKRERISAVIGGIDDKYIGEAMSFEKVKKSPQNRIFMRLGFVAAGLAMMTVTSAAMQFRFKIVCGDFAQYGTVCDAGGIIRDYKYGSIGTADSAMIYPWEYLTLGERFSSAGLGSRTYSVGRMLQNTENIGDFLGMSDVSGWDEITGEMHRETYEAYAIEDVEPDAMIALRMEDSYYIYRNSKYAPPSHLGELFDMYGLSEKLSLDTFRLREASGAETYFRTENGGDILDVLGKCRDAEFVEEQDLPHDWYYMAEGNIAFTVTCDELGVYKNSLCITKDGYLWTNIFGWAYIYNIGEGMAAEIIEMAEKDAEASYFEPYYYMAVGEITEINDDLMTLDDTAICTNESDGMTYIIDRGDLMANRCIECRGLNVGDMVSVQFIERLDTENGNRINGIITIDKAFLE